MTNVALEVINKESQQRALLSLENPNPTIEPFEAFKHF